MTDERGRKRDTPNGIVGPGGKNLGHVPRGAGLSGNLPGGSRFGTNERKPGSVPISIPNEPRVVDRQIHDPRRGTQGHEAQGHEASRVGPWDGQPTPVRRPGPPEPPMAAPRSPAPPRPPPAPTARDVDGFAATRPAEVVGGGRGASLPPGARGGTRQAAGSARPNERGAAGPSPRPSDPKQSLRLKLEGDTFYEANEGRVKVPKRRGPVFFGFLVLFAVLAVGAFLWIDSHGGVESFVAAVKRVVDSDPGTAVQTSESYGERSTDQPGTSGAVAAPSAQPPGAAAPAAVPQPSAAPQQPASPSPAAQDKPAEQGAEPGQIATGEVEVPEQPSANAAQPASETGEKAEKPPAAKPKPKPVAAKPKPKPVVRRDPVLKVQPLGDVLNEAPPDPGGGESLPPPDPPAPE
jgi:hypothetical protein